MMRIKDDFGRGIDWVEFIPALIIVVNSLTWAMLMLSVFSNVINGLQASSVETFTLFGIEYGSIAVAAILGSIFFPKSKRRSLLLWMVIGTFAPILITTIERDGMLVNSLVSVFFGFSVGAGLPSALACFSDATDPENRGFLGGLTFFFVGLSTVLFVVLIVVLGDAINVSMMTLWRFAGLLLFAVTYKSKKLSQERVSPRYFSVLSQRDFVLYLLPWVMFCLINWTEAPILRNLFGETFDLVGFIEVVMAGVVALVAGFIADRAGRKRVVMIGFVILGLNYAILSLFSGMQGTWYVYAILDSLAWGMFSAVFFMTLWGDLGRDNQKEKYYTLGGISYLLTMIFSELVRPYVGVLPLGMAFTLASFFLFLAVVPLMYAPETLPEKGIRDRELKDYVKKAKRVQQKYV